MNFHDIIQGAILAIQMLNFGWTKSTSTPTETTFDYTIQHQFYDSPRQNDDTIPFIRLAHAIDSWVIQIIPENVYILRAFGGLTLLIDSMAIVLFVISIFICISGGLSALNRQFNLLTFLKRFFLVIENEFTAPRSLLIIIALLSSTLLASTLFPAFSFKTPAMIYLIATSILLLLSMVLLWPISLIYNWGTYASIYIKGESTMSNLLGQVVMDYFYVVSFFLRINLQFLRLVVLSGVFIVYNEFYFEFIYPNYNFESLNFNPVTWDDYAFLGVKFVITAILRFIYELGHMWVVLIMQANAFVMILFLILQSLHTVYLAQRMQSYFYSKK